MHLTFEAYWPLILLLIVPYVWWVRRTSAVDLSPKHLRLSTVIRSAIVCMLALALMQPVLYKPSTHLSVVYLLDVSQSVAPGAIKKAIDWIQETNDSGKPDHSQFVVFGSNTMQFDQVEELKKVRVSNRPGEGVLDQSRTDIAGALDRAIRGFAPNHLKRVVLISDGNENSGDLAAILPRLKRENAHVYTVPLEARVNRDVWIESVLAPSAVTAGEQFPVEIHVYSQSETTAEIEVKKDKEVLARRSVHLT